MLHGSCLLYNVQQIHRHICPQHPHQPLPPTTTGTKFLLLRHLHQSYVSSSIIHHPRSIIQCRTSSAIVYHVACSIMFIMFHKMVLLCIFHHRPSSLIVGRHYRCCCHSPSLIMMIDHCPPLFNLTHHHIISSINRQSLIIVDRHRSPSSIIHQYPSSSLSSSPLSSMHSRPWFLERPPRRSPRPSFHFPALPCAPPAPLVASPRPSLKTK